MLIRFQIGQESLHANHSILVKLLKCMINGCVPFLSHIISDVVNKLAIGNAIGRGERILDCPDLLGGEEDAACIEE